MYYVLCISIFAEDHFRRERNLSSNISILSKQMHSAKMHRVHRIKYADYLTQMRKKLQRFI